MSDGTHTSDEVRDALQKIQRAELKQIVKDAIKEWLDEQAIVVGRWSIRFILMAALGALTYFILTQQGWQK